MFFYLPLTLDLAQGFSQMMKVHREHEEQWWKGRQDFIVKQEEGKINQKKLNETL